MSMILIISLLLIMILLFIIRDIVLIFHRHVRAPWPYGPFSTTTSLLFATRQLCHPHRHYMATATTVRPQLGYSSAGCGENAICCQSMPHSFPHSLLKTAQTGTPGLQPVCV